MRTRRSVLLNTISLGMPTSSKERLIHVNIKLDLPKTVDFGISSLLWTDFYSSTPSIFVGMRTFGILAHSMQVWAQQGGRQLNQPRRYKILWKMLLIVTIDIPRRVGTWSWRLFRELVKFWAFFRKPRMWRPLRNILYTLCLVTLPNTTVGLTFSRHYFSSLFSRCSLCVFPVYFIQSSFSHSSVYSSFYAWAYQFKSEVQ